jgi:Flp pilus assembly protein TadD
VANEKRVAPAPLERVATARETGEGQKAKIDRLALVRELTARRLYAVALGQLKELSDRGPASAEAAYLEGRCRLGLKEYPEAIESFQKALAMDGNHAASSNGLGLAYDHAGKRDLAVKAYKKAIELDPAIAEVYNNLGFSLLLSGRYEEAERRFLDALALRRDMSAARHNLALTYGLQGRYDLARSVLEQDGRASAIANLGVLYEINGDMQSAERSYAAALAEDGRLEEAGINYRSLRARLRGEGREKAIDQQE